VRVHPDCSTDRFAVLADAGDLRARGAVGLRDLQGRLGYAFAPAEIRARFDASREAL
jgi:hypothetical protein